MATTSSGYGLIPVKNADGSPYNGARDMFLFDPDGVSQNIGYGSIVQLHTDGYINIADGDGSDESTNNLGGNILSRS